MGYILEKIFNNGAPLSDFREKNSSYAKYKGQQKNVTPRSMKHES